MAVVELLLAADGPLRVSEVADALELSRSTCSAVLDALEHRGWVRRRSDLTYEAGRGLIPVANAVRARLPILQRADATMRALVDDVGAEGVTLSLVGGGHLTQVARAGPRPGVEVGPMARVPMHPPFAATVAAFARPEQQQRWLAEVADGDSRARLTEVLHAVRTHGVAVWRLDAVTELLSEAIFASQALVDRLTVSRRGGPQGRSGLLEAFDRLGFSATDLAGDGPFPVAYVEAPVADADGHTCYVLELHVLREAVSRARLRRTVAALRRAADELTDECGGTRLDVEAI